MAGPGGLSIGGDQIWSRASYTLPVRIRIRTEFHLATNDYNGRQSVQLIIEHCEGM